MMRIDASHQVSIVADPEMFNIGPKGRISQNSVTTLKTILLHTCPADSALKMIESLKSQPGWTTIKLQPSHVPLPSGPSSQCDVPQNLHSRQWGIAPTWSNWVYGKSTMFMSFVMYFSYFVLCGSWKAEHIFKRCPKVWEHFPP